MVVVCVGGQAEEAVPQSQLEPSQLYQPRATEQWGFSSFNSSRHAACISHHSECCMVAWLSCCNCARVSYDNNKARLGLYFADANFGYSTVSLTSSILASPLVSMFKVTEVAPRISMSVCIYVALQVRKDPESLFKEAPPTQRSPTLGSCTLSLYRLAGDLKPATLVGQQLSRMIEHYAMCIRRSSSLVPPVKRSSL